MLAKLAYLRCRALWLKTELQNWPIKTKLIEWTSILFCFLLLWEAWVTVYQGKKIPSRARDGDLWDHTQLPPKQWQYVGAVVPAADEVREIQNTGLVDKLKNEAFSDALRCKLWQQVLIANAPRPPLACGQREKPSSIKASVKS